MKLNSKWIVVVLVLVGLASCRMSMLQNAENVGVAAGSGKALTMDQVKQAIIRGAATRNWSMAPAGPGHMVGTLHLRSHVAVVDVKYDTQKYSITYKDSTNLHYTRDPDGSERIHSNYVGWIQNLRKSINMELLRM